MKDTFIGTRNYQRMQDLVDELLGSALGVELAAVIGRAGRGKTTSAERIFAQNPNTVYVLYQEGWSLVELMREITFKMCGTRPTFRQKCFEMIQNDLGMSRRLLMIDEMDRANLRVLNSLRNIHDICKVPILLIGEEPLQVKLAEERRLSSRVRDIIVFDGVTQMDVSVFYRQALDQKISVEQSSALLRHSKGDFRRVLTGAVKAERVMRASGISQIDDAVVAEVCRE